ncbi:MAG: extracellular solute-binding protein [Mycobacterium sp.]|nr:extracellular solute-binding protein [Mycobacterium sp.]
MLHRRHFLGLLGQTSLALLAACAPGARPSPTAAPRSALTGGASLPTLAAFQGPRPDVDGNANGVPPTYYTYPQAPIKTVPGPIGSGEDVTLSGKFIGPPVPPVEQNAAWQEVNKQLGFNLKFEMYPNADYPTRLQTLIAGNQLPDIFVEQFQASTMQSEPEFLESQCADLTPYLAGDAIKDYPNLANLPSYAWPTMVFNGKIFAVPRVKGGLSGPNGTSLWVSGKLFDQAGFGNLTFRNTDDFTAALKAITNPAQGVWGLGGTGNGTGAGTTPHWWFLQCFGAPNQWRNDNGKLTRDWETEEYKAALAYFRSLWDAGLIHPDTPSGGSTSQFYGENYAAYPNSFIAFDSGWTSALAIDPEFKPRIITPFSADGTVKPHYFTGLGQSGRAALRKTSPDRIKQLLGILNFFTAPFGSQEYLLLYFGVQGVDWSMDDKGNPRQTPQGAKEVLTTNLWFPFVTPPDALYAPALGDYVDVLRQAEIESYAMVLPNPIVGAYSKTDASQGTGLNQHITDTVVGIAYGRESISALDQAVSDWRTNGGDQIRSEYEAALQAG